MGKSTSIIKDIFILLALILLLIIISILTTGGKGYIRIIVSLIFLIPVIYQTRRVVRKIKAEDKLR